MIYNVNLNHTFLSVTYKGQKCFFFNKPDTPDITGISYKVIKFISDLQQVSSLFLQ